MRKRLTAMLLTLCMLFTMVPTTVFAAPAPEKHYETLYRKVDSIQAGKEYVITSESHALTGTTEDVGFLAAKEFDPNGTTRDDDVIWVTQEEGSKIYWSNKKTEMYLNRWMGRLECALGPISQVSDWAYVGTTLKNGSIRLAFDGANQRFTVEVGESVEIADIIIYEVITGEVSSVTFYANGGNIAPANNTYKMISGTSENWDVSWLAPTREGYTFNGWWTAGHEEQVYDDEGYALVGSYWSANGSNATWTGSGDKSFVADWTVNQYTIDFDPDGGSAVLPITEDYGTAVTAPDAPTKDGYIFAGWEPALPDTIPAQNITVTAQWVADSGIDLIGGTGVVAPVDLPVGFLDIDAHAVADVEDTEDAALEAAAAASNTVLTAGQKVLGYVTADVYTVGGEKILNAVLDQAVEVEVNVGTMIPNGTDVTIYHWNDAKGRFDDYFTSKVVAGYIAFETDSFSPFVVIGSSNYYQIQYHDNTTDAVGNMPAAALAEEGKTYTVSAVKPIRDGYEFMGWADAPDSTTPVASIAAVSGNIDLYAIWEAKTYHTITYLGNAPDAYNIPASEKVADLADYTVSAVEPLRTNYTFEGWATSANGAVVYAAGEDITNVTSDITLYAKWAIKKVDVKYPDAPTGVTSIDGQPTAHTDEEDINSLVTFNVTLEEGYDPATLTVTANGVTLAPIKTSVTGVYQYSFIAAADTEILVTAAEKLKYVVALPTGEHFDALFTAPTANVTSVVVDYGESYEFKVTPAPGYKISAVYVNGVPQTGVNGTYAITNVTEAQHIAIVMEEIPFYTINYTTSLGDSFTRQVQEGSVIPHILPLEREGYTFAGWCKDPECTESATGMVATGDTVLYGKYVAKTTNITYNLNEPEGTANPASITATEKKYDKAVALSTVVPKLTGYTFKGWATTEELADDGVAVYQPGDMYSLQTTTDVELFAVWEIKTYTFTINSGDGVTVHAADGFTVKHGEDFELRFLVDEEHAQYAPQVHVHGAEGVYLGNYFTKYQSDWYIAESPAEYLPSDVVLYSYEFEDVANDYTINIVIDLNDVYDVEFYTVCEDTGDQDLYLTQQVEWNHFPTVPVAPVIEGYTFGGWYVDDGFTTEYEFGKSGEEITADTELYAKMVPIVPEVDWTVSGDGWEIEVTDADVTDPSDDINDPENAVEYGSSMKFEIEISAGYDASALQVAANGVALAPIAINDNVYTYLLNNITADTTITVVGVVRKTVTITYYPNALDDTASEVPPQVVKYYLSDTNCDTINPYVPTRVGYTFEGWDKNPNLDLSTDTPKYKADGSADSSQTPTKIANFTADTALYAIWAPIGTTVELAAVELYDDVNDREFEDQMIKLTATITPADGKTPKGTMTFFKEDIVGTEIELGSVNVNGTTATFTTPVGAFKNSGPYTEQYWAVFTPEAEEGYSGNTSDEITVRIMSSAISWTFATPDSNKLTITGELSADDNMVAGKNYTLTIPEVVELNTGAPAVAPVCGVDYQILWQVKSPGQDWKTVATTTTASFVVTDYVEGTSYRALVEPIGPNFAKAAKFNYAADTYKIGFATFVGDEYLPYLYSQPTGAVEQQPTTTTLAASHTEQYEGDMITLTATVMANGVKVTTGEVYFYQNGEQIGIADVKSDGTATWNPLMSQFKTTDDIDEFKAVYQENVTYAESASADNDPATADELEVTIKSKTIVWETDKALIITGAPLTSGGAMIADNTYTLTLPNINVYDEAGTKLTVNEDYTVQWQSKIQGTSEWTDLDAQSADTYVITSYVNGYVYRAVITAKAPYAYESNDLALDNDALIDDAIGLITDPTTPVEQQETVTELAVTYSNDIGTTYAEYEGDFITLVATVIEKDVSPEKKVTTGEVYFYKDSVSEANFIGKAPMTNDGTATLIEEGAYGARMSTYKTSDFSDTFIAVYQTNPTFKTSQDDVGVQIRSKTIVWTDGNELIIKDVANKVVGDADAKFSADGAMIADETYTLYLPDIKVYDEDGKLVVNEDYEVDWQYKIEGSSEWTTLDAQSADSYVITSYQLDYTYRAVITAKAPYAFEANYTDAPDAQNIQFADGKLVDNAIGLITQPTDPVDLQPTTTDLVITDYKAVEGTVTLFGEEQFVWGANSDHLVEFEGDAVTLKATVVDMDGNPINKMGKVYFYKYVDGTNDILLNANEEGISVGNDGIATMQYIIPAYDTSVDADHDNNAHRIYAVYVEGETYETSHSVEKTGSQFHQPVGAAAQAETVYAMSTTIKTPVIHSVEAGILKDGNEETTTPTTANHTSYGYDLIELVTGIKHTFTLVWEGIDPGATESWSVVALDGRTVDPNNYDIQWMEKLGDNTEYSKAVMDRTYVTSNNKDGDTFYVDLIAKNEMDKGERSKNVVIGFKQRVDVDVEAVDAIAATTENEPTVQDDVYQLNDIVLTATVTAAEGDDATMQPTGTVTFYYSVDGSAWTELADKFSGANDMNLVLEDGKMVAKLTTDVLPVDAAANTWQNVNITAIYNGDDTFEVSGKYNSDTTVTYTDGSVTTPDVVTVYSSVVYNSSWENQHYNVDASYKHAKVNGIIAQVSSGVLAANETNVELTLNPIYTLDYALNLDAVNKLEFGADKDYTVQWQKLVNATAFAGKYGDPSTPWANIEGANELVYLIDVAQGEAYRAVITVTNGDINKGSYDCVDQVIDGRQVYYSNVLVAGSGETELSVNVNTSNMGDGYEGIVEGETVTVQTYVSGANGTTPIASVTTTITKQGAAEPAYSETKSNVNGQVPFTWTAAEPGYYTLSVTSTPTNGYKAQNITRTLIVRDDNIQFNVTDANDIYDGRVQALDFNVVGADIEAGLAEDAVVVYYVNENNEQVEPVQAGKYKATIRLQESAYWTEQTKTVDFEILKREVEVVDLIAQAAVYGGNANIQEIILNDAVTDQSKTGLPKATETTGIINGDSVYAVGTATINGAAGTIEVVGNNKLGVTNVALAGDDAHNYVLKSTTYADVEDINVARNQLKGDIANATYVYGTKAVPAEDIYLIDQSGKVLNEGEYDVTYYYHNGEGVEKVSGLNQKGMYTVIASKDQNYYKGGATQIVYVANTDIDAQPVKDAQSALINITGTADLFGPSDGVQVTTTSGTVTSVTYSGSKTVPTDAGRYLVKATTSTGDYAYGIYTITKANPVVTVNAANDVYDSARYDGDPSLTYTKGDAANDEVYYTYTGGTIQGVAYEAPTEVGTYVVTAHIGETANYTSDEYSTTFEITPAPLTITADSWQRHQYSAYPDMTASFEGLATDGVAVDTSKRDVQIQPELIFNPGKGYENNAQDQVGNYEIQAVAALARNYAVEYVNGNFAVTREDPKAMLDIHGMPDNDGGVHENLVYYGDVIQLYAYGTQADGLVNPSSIIRWKVDNSGMTSGTVSIGEETGILTVNGVGNFKVTVTRGKGDMEISKTIQAYAAKQELMLLPENVDYVYNKADQEYAPINGAGKLVTVVNAKYQTIGADVEYVAGEDTNRKEIGSQIVETVLAAHDLYVSENYGGLLTVNDKEATVAPGEQTTVYGTLEAYEGTKYTVTDAAAVSNVVVGSQVDVYANLDAFDGYEILVAATEDINYNVSYTTDQDALDAEVTDTRVATIKSGFYADTVGMTGGAVNPKGDYPAQGAVVDPSAAFTRYGTRMYGEPNMVMGYEIDNLIPGDSVADLTAYLEWIVTYGKTIDTNANVKFEDRAKDVTTVGGWSGEPADYPITSDMTFDNYTEAYEDGILDIYQRPYTIQYINDIPYIQAFTSDFLNADKTLKTEALLQLVKNNIKIGMYKDGSKEIGGLATLLGHTIEDLDLTITATYDPNASANGSEAGVVTVTFTNGNDNYWLDKDGGALAGSQIVIPMMKSKIIATYGRLGYTGSSVTMYTYNENGTYGNPIDVIGDVTYYIYEHHPEDTAASPKDYSFYKNLEYVRCETMVKSSRTGYYTVSYDRLPDGDYVMFAIAESYTII